MTEVSKLLALVFSSSFSAGLLVTSMVIVDSWGQMEPAAAVDWFATYGRRLGLVMAPMGGLAMIFSLIAFISTVRSKDDSKGKLVWLFASTCAVGTMVLLPLYFVEANTLFFDKTIALTQVPDEVHRWTTWNLVRAGLSIAATALILIGLVGRSGPSSR
ncbi:MAG: DUF1772 domain-containing protein [Pseudomonadota bacterium]